MTPEASRDTRPLILTLRFDDKTFAALDTLRQAHFPPALNFLPAHLTLFHHLPGDDLAHVHGVLRRGARRSNFAVAFTKPRSLGRGVALDVEATELLQIRAEIAATFATRLTNQDRQTFKPHVTIQNKVTPAEARLLLDATKDRFVPWRGQAEGLLLWRYLGPSWALEADVPFLSQGVDARIADSSAGR